MTAPRALERRAYQQRPVRYEYLITDKGRELWPVLIALLAWGDRHHAQNGPPRVITYAGCGGQVHQHLIWDSCGASVDADAIDTRPGPGARDPADAA